MRRFAPILGSAVFLVIAPGTIAVYVPWLLDRWRIGPPLLGFTAFRWVGVFLIALGLPVLLDSFARFAWQGFGTPAPVAPPKHLVVTGLYRYVRNPMYVAVTSLILGQGLLFGNVNVLEFGLVVWLCFHIFVLAYEEPTLRNKFGDEYKEFCANVRRWLPRIRPWAGTTES
jgi:protein-S-isoprenylcysteine O-methyltransferase Ste14